MKKLTCLLLFVSWAHSSVLVADQPLVAPDDAPVFKLGTIKLEDDNFGRPTLVMDYKKTKKGTKNYHVEIAARTKEGELNIIGFSSIWEDEGEIRLSRSIGGFGRNRSYDYEIYLVTGANWAGKNYGQCMVSNATRFGNPGSTTRARRWTAEEKSAFERHQKYDVPPAGLPDGHVAAMDSTVLIPGMIVKTGDYGEWTEAEFLGYGENDDAQLRLIGEDKVIRRPVERWISLTPEVLEKGESNPGHFRPSGHVLPKGSYRVPKDSVPLDSDVKLVEGTPLLYERGSKWKVAYVLSTSNDSVKVHFDGMKSVFDRTQPKSEFAIRKSTLEKLAKPDAASHFAANVNDREFMDEEGEDIDFELPSEMDDEKKEIVRNAFKHAKRRSGKRFTHSYPIWIDIPRGAKRLPADLKLPKGTLLAACHHNEWSACTVVRDNGDGTVEVTWNDRDSAWDGAVSKDELIIQNKTIKKIELATALTPANLSKKTRTWTDVSGQHELEAKFVKKTDTTVTLKTKDGQEKTLEIKKLSKKDQELLAKLKDAAENPFD